MELIIKPTEICNFHCTFCSSSDISIDKKAKLDTEYIRKFIIRFPNTNTIIVNGGDPLIMCPSYYYEIIDILDELGSDATISLTSNLWDFKLRPEKWVPLFRHERIGIATSFHYGNNRLITPSRVLTDVDFWEISNLMLEKVGYRPDFISVIDSHNYDTAIKNVELAKEMGVECKLNKALISGRQEHTVTQSSMFELYLKIIEMGLADYEYNTKQMIESYNGVSTTCPLTRKCDSHIRTLHPDGSYYSCGAFADDGVYPIDFKKEIEGGDISTPLADDIMYQSMKLECWSCDMFSLCNGCKKVIKDIVSTEQVEEHCSKMKSISNIIKTIPL